ncbi:MAG: polysaccharide deacetylase family protein [Lachnospiraceae bacterium]|jgi:peptidoglycan/xylan/chitin deacetylase (PgdA/CDA1 family)
MALLGNGHSEEFLRKRREQERRKREKRRKLMKAAAAVLIVVICVGSIAGISSAMSSKSGKSTGTQITETTSLSAEAASDSKQTTAETTSGTEAETEQTLQEETAEDQTDETQAEETTAEETQTEETQAEETTAEETEAEETTAEETRTLEEAATSPDPDVPEGSKVVYLTFDDGPSGITMELLDTLDSCGVKATFFLVGQKVDQMPDLAAEIVNRGHAVGLHSYDHDYNILYSSLDAFINSTLQAQTSLYNATGVTSWLYRFPGGSSNLVHQSVSDISMTDCANWLTENGFSYVDWNVDSGDAEDSVDHTADEIAQNVINGVCGTDMAVVLMHNYGSREATIQAIPTIVETLRSEGYVFSTLKAGGPTIHHRVPD